LALVPHVPYTNLIAPMANTPKIVLVVDDEPGVAEVIRGVMEYRNRYRVITALDHDQALSFV
jgi:hypothetical protein